MRVVAPCVTPIPRSRLPQTSPHLPSRSNTKHEKRARGPALVPMIIMPTMAHEAGFHGDRLRLASFLRIVNSIPQRPARFRRRADKPDQVTTTAGLSPAQHSQHESTEAPSASPAVDPPLASRTAVSPNAETLSEADHHGSSVSNFSMPTDGMTSHRRECSPVVELDQGNGAEDGLARDQPTTSLPLPPAPKVRKLVYAPEKRKQSRPPRSLCTRPRKQLPVKGLSLIRSTTEDGLPSRGVRSLLYANAW